MGKPRNKNGREVEHLKGEIRRLKKQLRQKEKHDHIETKDPRPSKTADKKVKEIERDERPNCDDCGKGKYDVADFGRFSYGTCDVCGDRKKFK